NDLLEDSPYEPVNSRLSDIFRLAPIVSVIHLFAYGPKGSLIEMKSTTTKFCICTSNKPAKKEKWAED
ncbi:hypothetical protein KIL84_003299, partial [Mauremys mutica]